MVPGSSVTIARSLPISRLNTDDLPTFGRPTMAMSKPSLTKRPNEKLAATSFKASSWSDQRRDACQASARGEAADKAAREGRAMSWEKAVAYAFELAAN